MNARYFNPTLSLVLFLFLASMACAGSDQPTPLPTQAPTDTPLPEPTATATSEPTNTPEPTATPDIAATKFVEDAARRVQKYVEKGYLPGTDGTLHALDDYRREMAQINYIDVDFAGFEDKITNFAVRGHVKWQSAAKVNYPEFSGCGFAYRFQDNGDGYTVFISSEAIVMYYCDSSIGRCGRLGTTRGKGTLDFTEPAEADLELVVKDDHAYVLVNDQFIGEYTLFKERLREPGYLIYSIISGTNKDYGTRCEITDAALWVSEP